MAKLVFPASAKPARSCDRVGNFILGMFDGLDAVELIWWIGRIILHALGLAARVTFHVLTCHF